MNAVIRCCCTVYTEVDRDRNKRDADEDDANQVAQRKAMTNNIARSTGIHIMTEPKSGCIKMKRQGAAAIAP